MIDFSRITDRIRFFLYAAGYLENEEMPDVKNGTWILNILEKEETKVTEARVIEILKLMEDGSWINGSPCQQPVKNAWSRATTEYVLVDMFPRVLCALEGIRIQ